MPIDNMICVNANILAAMDVLPIREKRAAPRKGIDFSCVDTKFKCEGVSCTVLCGCGHNSFNRWNWR
ncbi:hypothetical protein OESDEN_18839 [Oesophagostomum dentatum]|uniref:Uncharacterized protein n=1 Tax=Oesophagostomum dentatum TaxID=61180 RepID=A0A0B1SE15_OESDE|nr:hypothetical protein OESDEN_18839 [Oesophagostomum dentatum]